MVTQPKTHGAVEWADWRRVIDLLRIGKEPEPASSQSLATAWTRFERRGIAAICGPRPSSAPRRIKSDIAFLIEELARFKLIEGPARFKLIVEAHRHCPASKGGRRRWTPRPRTCSRIIRPGLITVTFDGVAKLPPGEAEKERKTLFKTIVGTLNHIMSSTLSSGRTWKAASMLQGAQRRRSARACGTQGRSG